MSVPILTRVLGNNSFYVESYILETINLTKSIVIKNHQEAKLYNDYLIAQYPGYNVPSDVKEWRYYQHLAGKYHSTDTTIRITSVDNGTTINLTKEALIVHKKTKAELLKFDLLYDDIVKKYPEQKLLVRSIIASPIYTDLDKITKLPDYSIVAYDKTLIEENEHDVIPSLQERINNYKHIWLIPYYQNSDNLFLASQYHILYNFLVTSILAVRLENAKTMSAHSFHIRLYLASHFNLDKYQIFLTRRQQLYLYRNLLYFANRSGQNHVFRTLINELFNEHNVSVVSYVFHQRNALDSQMRTEYVYNQQLLNSKNLEHNTIDYSLDYLSGKESKVAPSNSIELTLNREVIDSENKNSRFSKLLTKDLETILIDETDSVAQKLMDTIVDYLAFLLKYNQVNFLTEITDPVTNVTYRLGCADLFKLFTICLYAAHNVKINEFPQYRIKKVFARQMPSKDFLLKLLYKKKFRYDTDTQTLLDAIPPYRNLITSFEFTEFVTDIYKLNIGIWEMLCNTSELDDNGQLALIADSITQEDLYTFDGESVQTFLSRVGLRDPREYEKVNLQSYTFSILDSLFDKKLSYLNRLKKLQDALSQVFFKFNSYTVQLLNNYYNDDLLLAGIKDRRYSYTSSTKWLTTVDTGGGSSGGGISIGVVGGGSSGGSGGTGGNTGDGKEGVFVTTKSDIHFNVTNEHDFHLKFECDISPLVDVGLVVNQKLNTELMLTSSLIATAQSKTKEYMLYAIDDTTTFTDLIVRILSKDISFFSGVDYTHTNRYITQTKLSVDIGVGATVESQIEQLPVPLNEQDQAFFLAWK